MTVDLRGGFNELNEQLRILRSLEGTDLSIEAYVRNLKILDSLYSSAINFFNSVESEVSLAERSGKLEPSFTQRSFVGDVAQTLRLVAIFFEEFQAAITRMEMRDKIPCKPVGDAFSAMQSLVFKYRPEWVNEIRERLVRCEVPTYGFDEIPPPTRAEQLTMGNVNISNNSGPVSVNQGTGNESKQEITNPKSSQGFFRILYMKFAEVPALLIVGVGVAALIIWLKLKQ